MKPGQSLWTIIVLALACGCASNGPRPPRPGTITFESEPPGARIYLSYAAGDRAPTAREYMGQTPCTNYIPAKGNYELITKNRGIVGLNKFVPIVAVITAEQGTNTRQQTIRGDAMWKEAERVPKAMFFDFTRPQ